MRIGIVICSSCDLPRAFIDDNDINIMPITLKFADGEYIDVRDPEATQEFYKKYIAAKTIKAETASFTTEKISDWFLDELVLKYDRVLVLTIASNSSPIFENATEASYAILQGYREKRRQAGIKGSFSLRVVDTGNLLSGEALIAYETARLKKSQELPFNKWRQHIDELVENTYCFMIPNDISYLRKSSKKKFSLEFSAAKYLKSKSLDSKPIICARRNGTSIINEVRGYDNAVNSLYNKARSAIDAGLRIPVICISYAGDPEYITNSAQYKEFLDYATEKQIEVTMAVMSTAAVINLGPGGFSLAYATTD